MIEVVLTCLLFAGTYTPPSDWTVVSVELPSDWNLNVPAQGNLVCKHQNTWGPCPLEKGTIRLKRTFKPGDKIKVPDSCTMEAKP